MKTTQVTPDMKILDILPGEAPAVLLGKEIAFNGGKRLFTQKVAVTDTVLFQRLCKEVHVGDTKQKCEKAHVGDMIKATVVTDWRSDHYTTRLETFEKISVPVSVPPTPSGGTDVAQHSDTSSTENPQPSTLNPQPETPACTTRPNVPSN